jgi:hypothetical protein
MYVVIETRALPVSWDKVRERPAYCPGGDRHIGGVSSTTGFRVERGNLCCDAKGELQVEVPRGAEYRCATTGTDQLVVAEKPGNAGRAKGLGCPAEITGQPATGGARE